MTGNFDLFGDPIPEGYGRAGRPEHVRTKENSNKVIMLLALGWGNERISRALHITPPTLRKHYFRELKFRDEARDRLDARLAMNLWDQVEAGNVGAIREFRKLLEKNDLMLYGQSAPVRTEKPVKKPRLGKKEEATLAAHEPDTGSALGLLIARRQGHVN